MDQKLTTLWKKPFVTEALKKRHQIDAICEELVGPRELWTEKFQKALWEFHNALAQESSRGANVDPDDIGCQYESSYNPD